MASPHLANLAFAWEKYMDCRLGGAELQVSLQCLESFLCLFYSVRHLHNHHGNKDSLKFCVDMSGASNTLAREFLTDVHQLCSAVAQRAESRGEEDEEESHMVALGEYLVRGRGFLLLSALDSIIDQELTCREELLTLLLSLLPLVWKIPVQEEKAPGFTLSSLLDVFLSREVKVVPLRVGQHKKPGPDSLRSGRRSHGGGSSSGWKAQRSSRRTTQRYSIRDAHRSQLSTTDTDDTAHEKTSPAGAGGSRGRRSHGSTIRVSCQYHRSEAPSLPSPPLPPPEMTMASPFPTYPQPRCLGGSHTAMDAETLTDPAAMSIFNRMENSPFDLCHVLLSLLEKVCKFDMSINHAPGLAVSVVPTLTEILTDFGDCCGPGGGGVEELAGGWTEEPIALVQRMLLRTILHLMSIDVDPSEALPDNLRRSLTDLLRATLKIRTCLERQADPFAPRTKKTLQEVQDDFSFSRWRHRALLLPELLEGVLQVLLGCLQASTPNPFFFSQALELLHEFIQHRGLELLESTVLRLEVLGRARDSEMGGEAADRLRGLIAGVLKIISAVKKAKSEQLHQSVCARRRHRRCEYSQFLHHHRDLSGLPVSAFKQAAHRNPFEETESDTKEEGFDVVRYPERCCCLAACSHQCLRLLQRLSPSGPAALQVLAGVQAVGICCCMDPRSVVGPLLHAFQAPGLRSYQAHVLSVLSRLILDQLGGGQPSERAKLASCNICTLDSSQLPGLEETLQQGEVVVSSPSLSYRSQGILPSGGGAEDMLWKWDALEAYQGLVFGEDRALSQQLAGHVCHLTLRGNAVVQWQLYTHIFNPVLQRGVELAHHAQQLGVSTVCSQVCSQHSLCLPVEILLVYLHTLPTLLQSRVIRDLFLSCNGLNQVTELIYLDQTRSWALKVFETLILGTQGSEAIPGLTEELGSRGAGGDGVPQTLSKFYEGLKEVCPRRRSDPGAVSVSGRSRGDLNAINLFLCVAFLCVSKEADSDRDSANDSEDTSGYDSTASEPLTGRLPCLSPDSVALPSKEQVQRAADVWLVCRWIYLASPVFRRQFYRLGGLDVCSRLMALVIQKLTSKTKEGKAKKKREGKCKACPSHPDTLTSSSDTGPTCLPAPVEPGSTPLGVEHLGQDPGQGEAKGAQKDPSSRLEEDWPLQSIRLLEALLTICLHSASSAQQRIQPELSCQLQSVEETLVEVRDQLSRSGVVNSDLAMPLFDSLLRVALAEVCSSPEPLEDKPDRVRAEVQGCGEAQGEEGYEADSESNPEDMAKQEEGGAGAGLGGAVTFEGALPGGGGRGLLLFPEICLMELQLLAVGSPDLEVLDHVFHSLLGAVRANTRNAALLYHQGGVKTILTGFQNILTQSDPSYENCQTVLVQLLVAMVSQQITAEELALLIRLFLEKTPPTDILLKGVLQIVQANVDMEPLYFLSFPMVLSVASSLGGSSPSSRQNGVLVGKGGGVGGLLWKGAKLSPVGRDVVGGEAPGHIRTSPWHVAPLHLPLVGQNCWPHMASGFSASVWMKMALQDDGEGLGDRGNTPLIEKGTLQWIFHVQTCFNVCDPEVGTAPPLEVPLDPAGQKGGEGLAHLLSMGSRSLMLQVWTDLSTGSFTFRMCIDPNDDMKAGLLAQAQSGEGLVIPGRWHHLGISYTQQPEGKKNIHGRLALWVDGVSKCEVSLDYTLPRKSSLSSDSNKTFCLLGHCVGHPEECPPGGNYNMGTVLLFNGSRIGSEEAFHLYASGPDLTSIMPCKYGQPSGSFSKQVTTEMLKCETVRELLMKDEGVDTAALTAVELSVNEQTQALALQVLLLLSKHNQHRINEMDCYHGYSMIHQVLIKSKCIVGYHILKTLLDGCCSGPVLTLRENGQFRLDTESTAVIQDIKLLSDILLDWKIWAKAQSGVWEMLLAALEVLIRVHHPWQVFNIKQFLRAQVVHRFLLTCQVLQEHRDQHLTSIPQEVCLSFVKIIQEVLGSPPDLDLLRLVYNFLLAVHPPTNTYVCHTPTSFYFSLHIDGNLYQEKVKSIMYQMQSSGGGRSTGSSVASLSPSGFSQAPPPEGDHTSLPISTLNGSLVLGRWPSVADRATLPEDWESYTYSPGYEKCSGQDCLVLICCGLYDLLRGVLLLLPDLMLEEVMDKLIQPEALIVLVNHPSPFIQQGVMKLLDAYFSRAFKEQKEKFLKNHGFSLLANQLYLHHGSHGLVEVFLEMLFGRPVGLEEDLDLEDMDSISPFRKRCIIPVLGLLENSLYENSLVHNLLCMFLQLVNACPKLADVLLDHGLLYVLFNTLSTLNGMEHSIPLNDYKLLVVDIQQLLVAVTIHSCSSSGSQYFRIIEDLITLLGFLQTSKMRRTQEMAVALQFRVLQSAIEFIKTTANQDPQKLSGSVNVSTTPQQAIYQKRKSIAGGRRFSLIQSDSLLMRMRSVASDELSQMMQRRMSQENPIRASETEFIQRLQRLVVLAVNRLIYHGKCGNTTVSSIMVNMVIHLSCPSCFQKEILRLMMEGIKISLGSSGRSGAPRQQWKRILWSCRDTFRVQIGRLLVYTLSPSQPISYRKEALDFVFDPAHPDILRECLSPGLEHGPKLTMHLYEMLHDHQDALTKEEQTAVGGFMTSLKLCGHRCIPPSAPHKPDLLKAIKEEQWKYEVEEKTSKVAWEKKMSNTQQGLLQRLDGKSKDISKIAADITQNVSLRQGMERKKVIQHIRGLYKTDLSASRHWQELVQQLTHDRAVWYDQASYPTSWQLDPTEGPNRERRRLQRCYLTIPNKYLLKDRRKPEAARAPLSFLFEDKTHSSFSSTVKDKATSEPIRFTRRCFSVAPSRETSGELLLGKSGMYFVEDNAADAHDNQSIHGETEAASFSWTYEEIKEVHKRWWQLRDNAVEIFLTNGRTLLLAFDTTKFRDDVYHNILTSDLPNLLEYGNITALTHLWGSGQISNFEYLTHLNKHAGRSFNDLMQYPVFPFILKDYTSETLDLGDNAIYRNLNKPIAVQSKEKEDRYVDNYKYLEEEYRKGARDDDPMPPVQPYHYGSHYSNSGTVLHFLVRMPPFTKMFLAYQDQSFDIPDRTFHSMNTTWRLSSFESMTDVKELIPEFFYLPEFLVNREGFDFGLRQNSERVNHVNLPPWARNDPRLFILIHRQALESDQISQNLCHWIDLVFGIKQKGKAAVHAINVFHPATYFGMDVSSVEDPVQRRALETMIKTYGQTPRQLFSASHISRAGTRLLMEGELPAAMGLLVQLAFRDNREQVKEIVYPSPLPWIKGLKWGEYVGSPSSPDPVVCFSQPHGEKFGSLLALPTKAICGLSGQYCLMMIYSKEQGVRSMHSTDIQWSAILSWGYADNMLRLKSKQSEPPINFIQCSPLHQVTACAWVSDGCQLFTGSSCGVITAYTNRFSSTTPTDIEVESQVHLYGHSSEVTSLQVCKPYSILISVSKDGTCILWDLNRLCYVQSLAGHKNPVTAVSASETTGDIATVCDSVGGGSDLRLWTVNGDLIGHVHCREIICSVAFSNQPEGVSVNVIAGGLENGVVRLWSTWDLKPVREITFPKSNKPIISLTYSSDGHHLYTANSEGTVMAWCRRDQQRMKLPMFYSFLSSYAAG
uniref:Lysosomal trafficking regulator n=1 Tax=Esox lucius TaxID=8010 RepID=A0A6Q2WY50_ESOLU